MDSWPAVRNGGRIVSALGIYRYRRREGGSEREEIWQPRNYRAAAEAAKAIFSRQLPSLLSLSLSLPDNSLKEREREREREKEHSVAVGDRMMVTASIRPAGRPDPGRLMTACMAPVPPRRVYLMHACGKYVGI